LDANEASVETSKPGGGVMMAAAFRPEAAKENEPVVEAVP
jgi:hypothetical protein